MTWIVGTAPPFGLAILVSDICVTFTFRDGTQKHIDCLQKIYPLGPAIMGGFSGSVEIGFHILVGLHQILKLAPNNSGWSLNVIANTWLPRVIKRIYRAVSKEEQEQGASIILASEHPSLRCGDAPWPKTEVYTFHSPHFEPLKAEPFEVVSIGSGSAVDVYKSALSSLTGMGSDFTKAIMLGPEGLARILAHMISLTVENSPMPGISTYFQAGILHNRTYTIGNHEYSTYEADGTKIKKVFPEVAKSLKDFKRLSYNTIKTKRTISCTAH